MVISNRPQVRTHQKGNGTGIDPVGFRELHHGLATILDDARFLRRDARSNVAVNVTAPTLVSLPTRDANVGKVFSLGGNLDLGLFHFNKIANLHILPKICAWPQSGERTDARANTRAVPAKCACSRQSLRILSSST